MKRKYLVIVYCSTCSRVVRMSYDTAREYNRGFALYYDESGAQKPYTCAKCYIVQKPPPAASQPG